MKKVLFIILSCVLGLFAATAQDSLYVNKSDGKIIAYAVASVDSISFTRKTTTSTATVTINGVKWASHNVATPGAFTTNAEDYGDFYQWNSKVGWLATGAIGSITATNGITTWNSSWNGGFTTPSASDTWVSANDPSPTGYRVPTYAEIQTLLDATKVTKAWITQNSVSGYKFTDKTTGNSIFLPASGYRTNSVGTLSGVGSYGFYWSSTASGASGYGLNYTNGYADWNGGDRADGRSVRPVAE